MKFETNDDDVHFLQSLVQLDSKPISNTALHFVIISILS